MPKGNYDKVAPYYDRLSRLVFGNAITEAQQFLTEAIPANSSVLIAGGGTGNIIEQISRKHSKGINITYVESAKRMIALSKTKYKGENTVVFINQPIEEVNELVSFDVMITPFFFDNFSDKTAGIIFTKLHVCLKPKGLWLFSDFQIEKNKNIWQKILLKLMYMFFRLVCNIEASDLPDIESLFVKHKYSTISMKTFCRKFILSVIYRKAE